MEAEWVGLGAVIVAAYGVCTWLARWEVSEEVRVMGCEGSF